jgi:hypothetical protein
MSGSKLTKEKITELLEQSHERSFQRYHEEFRQEILTHFQAEREKSTNEETKNQTEPVSS